jgi:flagellar protein FlbT
MALRFDLGPFDELHVGKCVIKNSHERALFVVEGDMPILRGNAYLQPALANRPLEKFYCCIQKMYLEETHEELQGSYLALAASSLREDPGLYTELGSVDQLVADRQHFKALKALKKFIRAEAFTVDKTPNEGYVPRYGGWKK